MTDEATINRVTSAAEINPQRRCHCFAVVDAVRVVSKDDKTLGSYYCTHCYGQRNLFGLQTPVAPRPPRNSVGPLVMWKVHGLALGAAMFAAVPCHLTLSLGYAIFAPLPECEQLGCHARAPVVRR